MRWKGKMDWRIMAGNISWGKMIKWMMFRTKLKFNFNKNQIFWINFGQPNWPFFPFILILIFSSFPSFSIAIDQQQQMALQLCVLSGFGCLLFQLCLWTHQCAHHPSINQCPSQAMWPPPPEDYKKNEEEKRTVFDLNT